MFTFLALVVAVIALVIAFKAREEARELRRLIASGHSPAAREVPQRPAPIDAQQPIAAPPRPVPTAAMPPPRPVPPPPPPPAAPAPARAAVPIDWENLVGIKLFSWIAGIALVLAAVFLFKYSVEHGWLRPAVRATFGLITGIGLLIACELRIARNYRFTANAMDGAGIAILYATLFALHARWNLWPATAAFIGMLLVTAAAVFLSTRRDSVFIALLGLVGGFATPALLSSGENRPIELFSYLLLLNGGIAWIAFRKRWPLLTALSVALTAFYQWAWVSSYLTSGQLPLAVGIFAMFGVAGAISLWPRRDDKFQPLFRMIAGTSAVLPLLFAFFTAVVPQYGARYNVLFGFLLLMAGGLAAIAMWRGPRWLHALGGLASLLTFFVWLGVSYTPQSWPWSLVWLAAFIALYLLADLRLADYSAFAAPLLFFVFVGLALREPHAAATLTGAMFALLAVVLAFAFVRTRPYVAVIAIALSSIAIMNLPSPALLYSASQAALFALLLAIAYMTRHHALALCAVPFAAAAYLAASHLTDAQQLTFGAIVYALFLAYPLAIGARVKRSIAPHAAAVAASALFLIAAYAVSDDLGFADFIGVLPVAQAVIMLGYVAQLLRFKPQPGRLSFVASAGLAFLTIAVPMQLDDEWVAIAWAIEAAALAWLFTRVPQRGVLLWSGGLAGLVLGLLAVDPQFDNYASTYVIIAVAMFAAAWLAPPLRSLVASIGTIELFMLLNVSISDYYSAAAGTSLARDLTYTIGWALFAIAMLVTGLVLQSRGTRVAALGLLLVTVLKCFLYDLAQLGGLYRVASLFGLAVSLVLVGLMLQKFVMMKRPSEPATEPAAAPPNPTSAA